MFRPLPIERMPRSSMVLTVSTTPSKPQSPLWLPAVDTTSKPAHRYASAHFGSRRECGARLGGWYVPRDENTRSAWQKRMSPSFRSSLTSLKMLRGLVLGGEVSPTARMVHDCRRPAGDALDILVAMFPFGDPGRRVDG